MSRSSPCVGICSTTYGDLVCRGCKRFAHEVVGWNGYDETQRASVRARLAELRDGCVHRRVRVGDSSTFEALAGGLPQACVEDLTSGGYIFEVLRRHARGAPSLRSLGLVAQLGFAHLDPVALRDAIDAEFFERAVAHYERSFKTPVGA